MFGQFGWGEALLIFGIIVLLFGATRLPKLARSMGQSVKEFQKGKSGASDDEEEEDSNDKEITEGKDK